MIVLERSRLSLVLAVAEALYVLEAVTVGRPRLGASLRTEDELETEGA